MKLRFWHKEKFLFDLPSPEVSLRQIAKSLAAIEADVHRAVELGVEIHRAIKRPTRIHHVSTEDAAAELVERLGLYSRLPGDE